MELGLKGKGVIVTGASRGIGRAIALGFAREGANVAICARGAEALEATKAEIVKLGVDCYAAACDVGDAASLKKFLDMAHQELGGIGVLVNNPSGFGVTDDEAGWLASVNVDMMAAVRATWQVVPWLEAAGGGAIIHITSISGLEASLPGVAAYAAVKAALISHSKSMAVELAPKGIRVNCVAPGSIDFPDGFWDQINKTNKPFYDMIVGTIPSGRMGRPEEIANAVVFLASGKASWISGAMLPVDGVQHKGNL
ncbi:MAG: SDR family oxidoreductase [Gammaproteobacteria bacterium]|nr:SDR family oxidoreductase [Gammaproteobacteria bacterium]MBI5618690.1 SDR family oxidoreductase [Gammaproteobacteria bacterium]